MDLDEIPNWVKHLYCIFLLIIFALTMYGCTYNEPNEYVPCDCTQPIVAQEEICYTICD